jgi:hypothetical protein
MQIRNCTNARIQKLTNPNWVLNQLDLSKNTKTKKNKKNKKTQKHKNTKTQKHKNIFFSKFKKKRQT